MKKIVRRTKGFEKAFLKLQKKWRLKFIQRLTLFLDDEFHPLLNTHELKGNRKGDWSFSVANDIRAIYGKEIVGEKSVRIAERINPLTDYLANQRETSSN